LHEDDARSAAEAFQRIRSSSGIDPNEVDELRVFESEASLSAGSPDHAFEVVAKSTQG
jgi:hypothetical protein